MNGRALVDTGALLALAGARDQYHGRARDIARRHLAAGRTWCGTTLVLAEFHGLMVKRAGGETARRTVSALLDDPAYEWMDVPARLVRGAASAWLDRYRDQGFTLTDAVSFEVMRRQRIRQAFAFDAHFVTAGFELLP
jgi:predicted nucleic acid-binding protein